MSAGGWDERWERRCEEARHVPDRTKVRWLYILIRTMIEECTLRHREMLPSENQFKERYEMYQPTSREVYGRLTALGRVLTIHGGRRYVHMPAEPLHRLIVRRLESAGQQVPADEWSHVAQASVAPAVQLLPVDGAGPVTTRWQDSTRTVREWDAAALGLDPGVELLARVGTVSVGDECVLASISLVLPDMVGPTVRCSEAEIGELAFAGVSAAFDSACTRARMPTLVEEEMLGMDTAAPVFAVYRRCRVRVDGDLRRWPGCVLVLANGDRVDMPVWE